MKISDLLKLSTDNLRRRKGRTALTVIGVVVGTCAIVVMISLGIATNRRTDEMLSTWSDLTQIQVYSYSENPDTPALDDKMITQFKGMENVVAATPLYSFQNMNAKVVAGKKNRYSMYMNAVGMDVDALEPMGIELISGSYLTGQTLGRNKIPVLVGEDTAYQFEDTKKSYRNPGRYRWKETDENGNVTEILASYDPESRGGDPADGRKVKGATIHWVDAANCCDAEIRLYGNLFSDSDPDAADKDYLSCLNPDSLEVLQNCKLEKMLESAVAPAQYQFLRSGYFCVDSKDSTPEHLVFNRAVSLKDGFKK